MQCSALCGTGEWWRVGTFNKVRPTPGQYAKDRDICWYIMDQDGCVIRIPETKYTFMSTMGGWVQVKVHNGTVFLLDIWYL